MKISLSKKILGSLALLGILVNAATADLADDYDEFKDLVEGYTQCLNNYDTGAEGEDGSGTSDIQCMIDFFKDIPEERKKAFLDFGPPLGGFSIFYTPIYKLDVDLVELLIEQGADPTLEYEFGYSLFIDLMHSLSRSDRDDKDAIKGRVIAKLLIREGVEVDYLEKYSDYPLCMALALGDGSIVKMLLNEGVDVNPSIKSRWSPLHIAIARGNEEIVHLLLEHNANVNAATLYGGETPLHVAADKGLLSIVKTLVEYGADVLLESDLGYCPISKAIKSRHWDVAKYLINTADDLVSENEHS